jgi:hypothetical protein
MSEILTDEVVAAHRLPLTMEQISALCRAVPANYRCEFRGEWLVVMLPVIRLEPARKGGQP